ncbi:MAG: SAM-dependent methyltransferase [Acidimicrobiales bacterium]
MADIDREKAHVARVYDAMLGGYSHFEIDRRVAEAAAAASGGMEAVRYSTRSNRAFLGRAVRWLVDDGVRQFLDLGSGLPVEDNVHQVAQRMAPECRVLYVDFDPVVLAHATTMIESTEDGTAEFIVADMREPEMILAEAAQTLDFTRPIALLLFTILHNVLDSDDPARLVARYLDAVPSGSYLAISHLTGDFNPVEMAKGKEVLDEQMAESFILRSYDEILGFFTGTELVDPGLVHINEWHPDLPPQPPERPGISHVAPIYGGVGQKP